MVFFTFLGFSLCLIVPSLWWLGVILSYLGYLYALKHASKIMPVSGNLVLIEQDAWLQISQQGTVLEGVIKHAQLHAALLTFEIHTNGGKKHRLAFVANAMDSASWRHLSRIALQAN
ncbi:protein YgfX [Pseudoalteromonas luteoviolacea]|uniref:protein YgfX n=1 Tax=Pseudoalteromonas luteoviolacea TaxID=43657 RepID=UPI002F2646A4